MAGCAKDNVAGARVASASAAVSQLRLVVGSMRITIQKRDC
ncbi:hypothetical protein CFU_3050 [Collimonas fungivorans Ter331]|uniref:Uncharacterized protein n=1 Tax=Collimonas fungivorans (strain Ter331) TaxID=1005048 RepID=G0AA21_COLFT|nr:hypothetical protein CFU_3050 [Collimonas fungivorans Ter331]